MQVSGHEDSLKISEKFFFYSRRYAIIIKESDQKIFFGTDVTGAAVLVSVIMEAG